MYDACVSCEGHAHGCSYVQVSRQSVETFQQGAMNYPASYEKIADVNNKVTLQIISSFTRCRMRAY